MKKVKERLPFSTREELMLAFIYYSLIGRECEELVYENAFGGQYTLILY